VKNPVSVIQKFARSCLGVFRCDRALHWPFRITALMTHSRQFVVWVPCVLWWSLWGCFAPVSRRRLPRAVELFRPLKRGSSGARRPGQASDARVEAAAEIWIDELSRADTSVITRPLDTLHKGQLSRLAPVVRAAEAWTEATGRSLLALTTKELPMSSTDQGGGNGERSFAIPATGPNCVGLH